MILLLSNLFLSLCNMGLLLYQGTFLVFSGKRQSSRAVVAGLSLIVASLFFVVHAVGLRELAAENRQTMLHRVNVALYLSILIAYLFLINVLLSEKSFVAEIRDPGLAGAGALAPLSTALVALIPAGAFVYLDVFVDEGSALSGLLAGSLNASVFWLGMASGTPVVLAGLFLLRRRSFAGGRGRSLLRRAAISLLLLLMVLVAGFLMRRSGLGTELAGILILDLLSQLCILAGIILSSQASVLYEVFSGNMPRLGMHRYYWKNVRTLGVVSLFVVLIVSMNDSAGAPRVFWLLLPVILLSIQSGYLEYRLMRDRERMLARMQPFDSGGLLRLFGDGEQDIHDRASALLLRMCEEFGLKEARIRPLGSFASLLGAKTISSASAAAGENASEPSLDGCAKPPGPKTTVGPTGLPVDDPPRIPVEEKSKDYRPEYQREPEIISHFSLLGGEGQQGEMEVLGQRLTREEREFLRVAAERLLDSMAILRFSSILMDLQKQYMHSRKLGETMARRVLHDEVLPEIHGLILEKLSRESRLSSEKEVETLKALHHRVAGLLRDMPGYDNSLGSGGLLAALQRIGDSYGLDLELRVEEPSLSDSERELVFYALREVLRNATRYGKGRLQILPQSSGYRLDWLVIQEGPYSAGPGSERKGSKPRPAADSGAGQGLSIHSALLLLSGGGLEVLSGSKDFRLRIFMK